MTISSKLRKKRLLNYNRYEKRMIIVIRAAIRKYLKKQGKNIANHVRDYFSVKKELTDKEINKLVNDIINSYDFNKDEKELRKLLNILLLQAGDMGNNLSNIQLYVNKNDYKVFGVIEEDYLKFLNKHGLELAKNITNTTKDKTKNIISNGLKEGESYSKIADDIVNKTDEISLGRAKRIAVTETHTSFMSARDLNAREAGFKEKMWLTSGDISVRPQHQEYGSLGYVKIDYLYGGNMKYPGDPNGIASDVVNCRCEIMYK